MAWFIGSNYQQNKYWFLAYKDQRYQFSVPYMHLLWRIKPVISWSGGQSQYQPNLCQFLTDTDKEAGLQTEEKTS